MWVIIIVLALIAAFPVGKAILGGVGFYGCIYPLFILSLIALFFVNPTIPIVICVGLLCFGLGHKR